ncbi:conserved hypothetical protein [Hyphomicrobium denitrificans ATCC 51888]|uniref:Uncharacterized protein n=1 Tax=Hyphomicrobium denitrificans (strain ATCC 51888 / DSM 1869 / NCIMB 11706 / TK 0415) TaxID=582899 RepID=D8JXR0_HYPDA|nr:hypothetical protein [Hyphomicrobium denitrificans]ADJ23269.1 conserved hypothetical protein [Hyphomicrobium denitrificans ATCC 51888]
MITNFISKLAGWSLPGLAAMASVALISAPSFAEDAKPEVKKDEWPCIYRKVPQLTAAMIWDGPEITDTTSWHKDDAIRKLSQFVISRRVKSDEVDTAIKKYAAGLPEDQRDAKLTELFSAVLARTNDDRKTVMSGIEKFHKRQVERSKEIEKEALEIQPEEQAAAEDPGSDVGVAGRASDAVEKYKWEIRTFQEKQANIPIACEIPQLIDERAGEIARAIRAEMKS